MSSREIPVKLFAPAWSFGHVEFEMVLDVGMFVGDVRKWLVYIQEHWMQL